MLSYYIAAVSCTVYKPIMIVKTYLHIYFQPTVDKFITMNRGINCGGDLPKDLLVVSIRILCVCGSIYKW